MKKRSGLLAASMALVALTVTGLALNARAQISTNRVGAAIILKCRNYGGQQDVSKNPDIINSTTKTIPSGKTLYWKSTDGDAGSVVLDHALAPGGKLGVNGKPGQSYTCSAWMMK